MTEKEKTEKKVAGEEKEEFSEVITNDMTKGKYCPHIRNECNGRERKCICYIEVGTIMFKQEQLGVDKKPKEGEKPTKFIAGDCSERWTAQFTHETNQAIVALGQILLRKNDQRIVVPGKDPLF